MRFELFICHSGGKKMRFGKKGLSTANINTAIIGIVLLVVLLQLYSVLVPEAQTAGQSLNDSGVPLGTLFLPGGIVFLIIMAGLVFAVVRSFLGKN